MGCLTIETWLLFITNVFGLSLYFLYFCLYHLECYFMKEIKLETKIRIYSLAELPEEESRLMEAAIKATGQSYAPYSKFHVGAAALLEDGTIITGSNQENAAYPSGLCAERVALFHAGHQYPDMPVVRHEWPAGREHFSLRCMPPGFVGGGTTLWQADEGLVVRHERGCGGGECRITVAALFWGERSEIKKKSAIVNNGRSSFFIFGYCLSEIRFLTKPLSLRSFLLLLFRQPAVRRGSLLWNGLRNRT